MPIKIAFIINPISGGVKKTKIIELIEQHIDRTIFEPELLYTQYSGHASLLAQEALNRNIKLIVAVGGDGTINEISGTLISTDGKLGIIPVGSGNGFARHLGIPMDAIQAIQLLHKLNSKCIDTGKINNKHFVATCGVGFDAHIGKVFATLKGRGLKGYIKACLTEFPKYKPETYELIFNNTILSQTAFLITFANTSQYGNNAVIAPLANEEDGLLDICILKPFSNWKLPLLGYRLFTKNLHISADYELSKAKSVLVRRNTSGPIHIDGEPDEAGNEIQIKIIPKSLHVLC